jgi:serine/threonine protein kinase/uncharacterized protein HemY
MKGRAMSDWNPRANEIFLKALEFDSQEERQAYIEEACSDSPDIRREVQSLLEADQQAGNFLESPVEPVVATLEPPKSEPVRTLIGPYRLLQQIGEGGMGIVYMAQQERPVQRTVALKIIKPGMDSCQVIARIEAERQALALMDHPNIARFLDAGTTETGRPYFVMELVKGVPIIQYADEHRLTPRQRLELIIPVCQAIQHAHQKGIIHRDLKPTNVLVADRDDRPVPKVIDFGVAKAIGRHLTERTMFTALGQVVGTIEYMSPEQAKLSQLDIDTRTDIYSLGVLLYELLTGKTPFDRQRLRSAAFDEMLRIIREEEPPKPSTRLSDLGRSSGLLPHLPGEGRRAGAATQASELRSAHSVSLASIAASRQLEPNKLVTLVSGDLDWIVMKALEKDRSRRYETAAALAEDVQRYLRDEPVEARRPSRTYRIEKFIRRNKTAVFACLAGVAALVIGIVMLLVTNSRIRQASAAKDAALATARQAVDQMLVRVGDETLGDVPLAQPLRRALYEDAIKFYEGFVAQAEGNPALREELARVLSRLATIQSDLGRYDEARRAMERSLELCERLVAATPSEFSYQQRLATTESSFGFLLKNDPSPFAAREYEAHYRRAVELYSNLERDWPDRRQDSARCYAILADTAKRRHDDAEAQRYWRQAIDKSERYLAQWPSDDAARVQLSWLCQALGDSLVTSRQDSAAEAEQLYQNGLHQVALVRESNPRSSGGRYAAAFLNLRLCELYDRTGRVSEAIPLIQKATGEVEALLAANPGSMGYWPAMRQFRGELVNVLTKSGHRDEARTAILKMSNWLLAIAPLVPSNPEPQADLQLSRQQVFGLLLDCCKEFDSGELSRALSELAQSDSHDDETTTAYAVWQARDFFAKNPGITAPTDEARTLVRHAIDKLRSLREQKSDDGDARQNTLSACSEFARDLSKDRQWKPELDDLEGVFLGLAHEQLSDSSDSGSGREAVRHSVIYHSYASNDAEYRRESAGHSLRIWAFSFPYSAEFAPRVERALREAIAVFEKLTVDFPTKASHYHYLADTRRSLGNLFERTNRPEKAEAAYRSALNIVEKNDTLISSHPTNDAERANVYLEFAGFLARSQRIDEAAPLHRKGCDLLDQSLKRQPNPAGYNDLAWRLAASPVLPFRDPPRAVQFASKAVELAPSDGGIWNTLGVAQYRAEDFSTAVTSLQKSMDLRAGGDAADWFFLAMAHWQLGHKDDARVWYEKSVNWMDKNQPKNEELLRFRAEAAELLGISDVKSAQDPLQETKDE